MTINLSRTPPYVFGSVTYVTLFSIVRAVAATPPLATLPLFATARFSRLDLEGGAGLADAAMDVARRVRRRVRARLADLRRYRHAALLLVREKHSKLAMSLIAPKPKCRDVRDLIAIGWKADTKRTSPEVRV